MGKTDRDREHTRKRHDEDDSRGDRHREGDRSKHRRERDHHRADRDDSRDRRDDSRDRRDDSRDRRDDSRERRNDGRDHRDDDRDHRDERREYKDNRDNERDYRSRGQRGRGRGAYANRYRRNRSRSRSRSSSFDHANATWGKKDQKQESKKTAADKEKPNFGLSGKLTAETNTYRGVVIKYSEPPEARKPKRRWRLYPFKGEKALQTLFIHRESGYLIGRDRKVVDLPVDHPSCSKQHAALQYRLVPFTRPDGSSGKRVRPYLIDLESANGTFVNNKRIEPKKYVELLERDVIKFGFSSREYVLLHENSKDEAQDDDVKAEEEEVVAVKEEEV